MHHITRMPHCRGGMTATCRTLRPCLMEYPFECECMGEMTFKVCLGTAISKQHTYLGFVFFGMQFGHRLTHNEIENPCIQCTCLRQLRAWVTLRMRHTEAHLTKVHPRQRRSPTKACREPKHGGSCPTKVTRSAAWIVAREDLVQCVEGCFYLG